MMDIREKLLVSNLLHPHGAARVPASRMTALLRAACLLLGPSSSSASLGKASRIARHSILCSSPLLGSKQGPCEGLSGPLDGGTGGWPSPRGPGVVPEGVSPPCGLASQETAGGYFGLRKAQNRDRDHGRGLSVYTEQLRPCSPQGLMLFQRGQILREPQELRHCLGPQG